MADDVEASSLAEESNMTMTPEMRYYYRNREVKIAKDLARYHSKPEVIAKKLERERKRAEKEAEKQAKREEKERIRQEKLALAISSKRKIKEKPKDGFDNIQNDNPPVEK